MKTYKVGDKVKGMMKSYDPDKDDYPNENNKQYSGTISHDFEDGSYLVFTGKTEILIELYNDETMESQ